MLMGSDTALYNLSAMATKKKATRNPTSTREVIRKPARKTTKATVNSKVTPTKRKKAVAEAPAVYKSAASDVSSGTTTAPIPVSDPATEDKGRQLSFGQAKAYLGLAHSTMKYHVYGRSGKNGTEGGTLRPDGESLGRQYWYESTLNQWRVSHLRSAASA